MESSSNYAKITRPVFSDVLQRERLFRLLDEGRKKPVAWVSAPGGSGKTTLVASYLDARRLPCLWYQVDEGDADPAGFFYYMGMAAKKAVPRRRKPLPLLTPEHLQNITVFTQRFFEELYLRLKSPSVIVFDNYQDAAADSPFHDVINRGLGVIPEGIRVIVISRNDPPPKFARLRANNRMGIVGWDDMRFTLEETADMVSINSREKLSPEVLTLVHDKTDGWVAGLVLLLEKARQGGITEELIGRVTRESIFDYFASEIFNSADEETREFLLKTAFLPQVVPAVAGQLTGSAKAGQILSRLNDNHFFTAGQKGPGASYQYHSLFREFLQARAAEVFTKEEIRAMQKLAAELLEKHRQPEEAVDLFIKAGDWASTTRLICSTAPFLFSQGRSATVKEWIDRIPHRIVEKAPYLLFWYGNCVMGNDPAKSRESFKKAFELFRERKDRAGMFLAWAGAADVSLFTMDYKPLLHWVSVLEPELSKDGSFPSGDIESRIVLSMFNALSFSQPQHENMGEYEERSFDTFLMKTDLEPNLRVQNGLFSGVYYSWTGNFKKAGIIVNVLREIGKSPDVPELLKISISSLDALYSCLSGDSEYSIEQAMAGLRTAEVSGIHVWDNMLINHGIASALSLGDMKTFGVLQERIKPNLSSFNNFDTGYYHGLLAWEAMLREDFHSASEHAEIAMKSFGLTGMLLAYPVVDICMTIAHNGLGNKRHAKEYLAKTYETAKSIKSPYFEFQAMIVEAQMCIEQGQEGEGIGILKKAFALGRRNNYLNMFCWRPGIMAQLCVKALENGIEVDYACDLIRKRNLAPKEPPLHIENWPWRLTIRTLGNFAIERDGVPVAIGASSHRKPLDMMKALITFGGENVREEDISDILWPDAEGDAAHSAFTTTLSRLRKLIGDDAISVRGRRVGLDPRNCWTDVRAFDFLTGRLEAAKAKGPEEVMSFFEKVRRLYRGPLFASEADRQHYYSLRERLRAKFLGLVIDCGKILIERRRYEDAIIVYRKGLEVDELAEEFYRGLMTCYVALGRYSEGLAVYRRCRDILGSAFDVAPSRETEDLYKTLKKNKK